MLDHLHIQNYRLFKDLKIDKLGQVNLIAGKNNTGKTALLEALRIANGIHFDSILSNIIYQRGDYHANYSESFYTLFNQESEEDFFQINTIRSSGLNDNIKFVKSSLSKGSRKYGSFYVIFDDKNVLEDIKLVANPNISDEHIVYLAFHTEIELVKRLWDTISLTPNENEIIKILQIIEPKIVNVRVDNDKIKVLINGDDFPIPIRRLGEGVNRLFTIALGLVSAKSDKTLLIDEFEVGLHHSVQEQLWDIIFKYAKEWNIQVFVTTHSQDTVKAFSYVSSKEEFKDMGQYMRLQKSKINNEIEAVIYSKESLDYAIEDQLETR